VQHRREGSHLSGARMRGLYTWLIAGSLSDSASLRTRDLSWPFTSSRHATLCPKHNPCHQQESQKSGNT